MIEKNVIFKKRSKRIVIIHRHIFKNAGTTFDSILNNNFGEAFCDHRDDMPMRKEGEKYLIQYLNEHPEIKALSSHHIWFNPKSDGQFQFIPIIFLRHPIERIRSVYNFERQQQADTHGALMAKKLDFKDYVIWRMQDNVSPVIRNMHTRFLAGVKGPQILRKKDLRAAIKTIEQNPFIGMVDLFDESLKIFDKAFQKKGIQLNFDYLPRNISQHFENADYEVRAEEVLDELGEIAKTVLAKNDYDLKIYSLARKKIIPGSFGGPVK